jgi:Fe-S oxidoreductase
MARSLLERSFGISRHRPLPRFHRDTLTRWFARRGTPSGPFPRGELILLADSFTTYTEPAIGRAAVELLELAGWRVRLATAGCCGRASISKGLLGQARMMADTLLDGLAPAAEQGIPIAGIEPSCLLTLRDEYSALLPGDRRVRLVAAQARLVPELLLEAIDDGTLVLGRDTPISGRRILLHGHCHEKAIVGTATTRALLERIPDAQVHELDAGCCGMAGSFGFESEHYELSMKIGGLRLFPALATEAPDTVIAATGASCRQQIAHGGGRTASHPVELIRLALESPRGRGSSQTDNPS